MILNLILYPMKPTYICSTLFVLYNLSRNYLFSGECYHEEDNRCMMYILCGFFFQLFEPQRWYVFGMKSGIPFLEYYDKEESAFSGEPLHSFCMANCKRITYTMGRLNKVWTFCIFLEDRILELTAESRYCFVYTELLMNLNFE